MQRWDFFFYKDWPTLSQNHKTPDSTVYPPVLTSSTEQQNDSQELNLNVM